MKSLKSLILFLLCSYIVACSSVQPIVQSSPIVTAAFAKKHALTDEEKKDWHFKDIYTDSVPGISLYKAYELLKDKRGDTIVVAVIDTEIDINHKDLKDQVWINKDEIPNNNIDDDNNGYIDDVYGWNFLGTIEGGSIQYSKYACMRIMEKYEPLFKNKTLQSIPLNQRKEFKEYKRAIKTYKREKKDVEDDLATYKRIKDKFLKADSLLTKYFPKKNYKTLQLDSLSKTTTDSILKMRIRNMKYYLKNNIDVKWSNRGIARMKKRLSTMLNFTYNDRQNQRDDPNNLSDVPYGNNNVQGTKKSNHGTKVTSIIAATRNNDEGIDGITNLVKIMPVVVAPFGNEHDKDIALGIRYAVDNGAQIINMSIGKEFSMHPDWLEDAIKYAESKDVLIVSSTGNKSYKLDNEFDYPDDYNENGEYVNNFIKVGASSFTADSTLVWLSSNYSTKNVDIFAPAHKIYVQSRGKLSYHSGTSFASAVVTGIASLIRSHYPNLSAIEVKEVILKSGIIFNIDVERPYPYGDKPYDKKIPFSSMSKTGKIVNAYNALLLAEEVSKKKRKK